MKTREISPSAERSAASEDSWKSERESRDVRGAERSAVDPEQHWNELHQSNGGLVRQFIDGARRRIRNGSVAELAGAAIAGVALGYLLFSPRRPRGVRELLMGSLIPFATKGVHDTYEKLAHNKRLRRLGTRASSNIHLPW